MSDSLSNIAIEPSKASEAEATENVLAIQMDNNNDSTIAKHDSNGDSMIAKHDSNNDNMITSDDSMIAKHDNNDDNMTASDDNMIATLDNTITTDDNNENSFVTLYNTVLQHDNNIDNIDDNTKATLDNIDNNGIQLDNTEVLGLKKSYLVRLEGVDVKRVSQLSNGDSETGFVTKVVKDYLNDTKTTTVDIDEIIKDERARCAAQHEVMMQIYLPIVQHEKILRDSESISTEKYNQLYEKATSMHQELQAQSVKPEHFELANLNNLPIINEQEFQHIIYELTKVLAKNRFVSTSVLHQLSINLFSQISQKHD